uniref:Uncharacterized protein n=1 Tax=Esox lucius TaxID=8010 RepID=A0A3P8YAK2_ESOLU
MEMVEITEENKDGENHLETDKLSQGLQVSTNGRIPLDQMHVSPLFPPLPIQTAHFSSMTSLQKEAFFDLVATSQGRRLDDQRAELNDNPPSKPKSAPTAVQNEDLYNMILTSQAQGRLEEQRSAAPGPMDDEDFFSLLLSVQGGRMEDQRTELPGIMGT